MMVCGCADDGVGVQIIVHGMGAGKGSVLFCAEWCCVLWYGMQWCNCVLFILFKRV